MASVKSQLKLSSFYGNNIARPFIVLDTDGKTVQERVDAPKVHDALIQWANKVPFSAGGALMKPTWSGEDLKEPRNDFQIFFQVRLVPKSQFGRRKCTA